MKEKTLKFMSKYLLFGVITCMIGFGAASCGEDYDDTGIKNEMKGLKETLAKLESSSVNKDGLSEAVKTAVAASKNEVMAAVAGMISSGGQNYTVAQTTEVLGQLMALNSFFSTSTLFAQAVTTFDGVVNELGTKAGTAPGLLEGMKQLATDVAMLKNQIAVLGTVTGTGSNAHSSVIDQINSRLDAIGTGTGGGTPNYDAIAAALTANQAFMAAIMGQVGGDLNMIVVNNMITGIALVDGAKSFVFGATKTTSNNYIFGEGRENAVTFTKDEIKSYGDSREIQVRVTPANAALTKEMLSIVNSKGEDNVSGIAKIESVEKYTGDPLTRATLPSVGLYTVKIKFDVQATKNLADALTKVGDKKLEFALAAKTAEGRHVLTDFDMDIAMDGKEAKYAKKDNSSSNNAGEPKFEVGGKNIELLKNSGADKVWETAPTVATAAAYDDRSNLTTEFSVRLGQSFEVKMNDDYMYAYYVALDSNNPLNSGLSESGIAGLNKVYRRLDTGKFSLTLNDSKMNGRTISLRLFAVNYDGTLVDPDGRAFNVLCSNSVVSESLALEVTAAQIMTAQQTNGPIDDVSTITTADVAIPFLASSDANLSAVTKAMIKLEGGEKYKDGFTASSSTVHSLKSNPISGVRTADATKNIGFNLSITGGLSITVEPWKLQDNASNAGKLFLYNADDAIIAEVPFTLKKTLPTVALGTAFAQPITALGSIENINDVLQIKPIPVAPVNGALSKAVFKYTPNGSNLASSYQTPNTAAGEPTQMITFNNGYTANPAYVRFEYNYGPILYEKKDHKIINNVKVLSCLAGYKMDGFNTGIAFASGALKATIYGVAEGGNAASAKLTSTLPGVTDPILFTKSDFFDKYVEMNSVAVSASYYSAGKTTNEAVTYGFNAAGNMTLNVPNSIITVLEDRVSTATENTTDKTKTGAIQVTLTVTMRDKLGASHEITERISIKLVLHTDTGAADFTATRIQ